MDPRRLGLLVAEALDILVRVCVDDRGERTYGADIMRTKTEWILRDAFLGATGEALGPIERFKLMLALPLLRALRYADVEPLSRYGTAKGPVFALFVTDEGMERWRETKRAA